MTSSTSLPLSKGVHLAWLGADVVVLDTAQDRYSCLINGASYLTSHDEMDVVSVRDDVLEQLIGTGWVNPAATPSARTPILVSKRCISRPAAVRPMSLLGVAANALAGEREFRRAAFRDILVLADRYKRQAGQGGGDKTEAVKLVSGFYAALPWLPGQGLCLHRCFMLLRYLARRGIACDWVFGVRTWPFAAHCWLVIDDAVVGDELDRVRAFTPILVV